MRVTDVQDITPAFPAGGWGWRQGLLAPGPVPFCGVMLSPQHILGLCISLGEQYMTTQNVCKMKATDDKFHGHSGKETEDWGIWEGSSGRGTSALNVEE